MASLVRGQLSVGVHAEHPCFCFLQLYVLLVGPALAAGAFAQEREQGTLPALLSTPLSPLAMLEGKLRFFLRVTCGLALLNSVCCLELVLFGSWDLSQLVALPLAVAPSALFAVSVALFASLRWPTTVTATLASYAMLGAVLGLPLLFRIVLVLAGVEVPAHVERVLTLASPFLAALKSGSTAGQLGAILLNGVLLIAFSALSLGAAARRVERTELDLG